MSLCDISNKRTNCPPTQACNSQNHLSYYNKDRIRMRTEKNRTYQKLYQRNWRIKNHEAARNIWRKYAENHHLENLEISRKYRFETKIKAIKNIGGACVNCGCKDVRLLTVNHKEGNGLKHLLSMSKNRGNASFELYRRIANRTINNKDFDSRCYNCQILFEYERGMRTYPKELPLMIE